MTWFYSFCIASILLLFFKYLIKCIILLTEKFPKIMDRISSAFFTFLLILSTTMVIHILFELKV